MSFEKFVLTEIADKVRNASLKESRDTFSIPDIAKESFYNKALFIEPPPEVCYGGIGYSKGLVKFDLTGLPTIKALNEAKFYAHEYAKACFSGYKPLTKADWVSVDYPEGRYDRAAEEITIISKPVKMEIDMSKYPHKCPRCSAPAYIGFTSVDCSRMECM